MRTIIAGGRDYELTQDDCIALQDVGITQVLCGGATGADAGGERWAMVNRVPCIKYRADWTARGLAAGPIRNAEMASHADAVVLFPGGRGTESMHREAVKAGLKIFDWRHISSLTAVQPTEGTDFDDSIYGGQRQKRSR